MLGGRGGEGLSWAGIVFFFFSFFPFDACGFGSGNLFFYVWGSTHHPPSVLYFRLFISFTWLFLSYLFSSFSFIPSPLLSIYLSFLPCPQSAFRLSILFLSSIAFSSYHSSTSIRFTQAPRLPYHFPRVTLPAPFISLPLLSIPTPTNLLGELGCSVG